MPLMHRIGNSTWSVAPHLDWKVSPTIVGRYKVKYLLMSPLELARFKRNYRWLKRSLLWKQVNGRKIIKNKQQYERVRKESLRIMQLAALARGNKVDAFRVHENHID